MFEFFYQTRISGSVREDQYTFLIISRSVLLGMRCFWDKSYRENENTHFMFNTFFFKLCHLWEKVERYCSHSQASDGNVPHVHFMLGT